MKEKENKQQAANTNQGGSGDSKQVRRHNRRTYHQDGERKKEPEPIPIQWYGGPSNNFIKFKEAISKKALFNYRNLGKLIKQGYIVLP
jgi:hypothetical protein